MSGRPGPLHWLLLLALMQPARAALKVSVPSSPIRALPGSNVKLPCNISDSSGPLSLSKLAVMWKKGEKIVAHYDDVFEPVRPGAMMFVDQLLKGDATLLLQGVQDSDASVYSCFVIHMPNREEGRVELKVEAPPHMILSPTKVQLDEPSAVMCTMSKFYPSHMSVEWLKNDVVIKGPESPLSQRIDGGLFNATSSLQLIPRLADVDANFSCRVHHQALDGLLKKDFQLQVQACPIIQELIVLKEKNLIAAKCLVSGFYPKEIKVQWLKNGKPQETMQTEPQQMPNGTFFISSSIIQAESDPTASCVCQVLHESLTEPLKLTAHWQPKGESENIINSTSPTSTEKILIHQQSQPTHAARTPTGFASYELCLLPYVIGIIVAVVVVITFGAAIFYCKTIGKIAASGTKDKARKLQGVNESRNCTEKENLTHSIQVAEL